MNDVAGPIHHAAAKGYTAKAETYARGRPDYPTEIVDWLSQYLNIEAGKTAVDLGAGTGKFTRYLVKTGARVIAVEPVRQMRGQLAKLLPEIDVLEGTATAIPLPDNSVDALTCAQSFYWFATKASLTEIHRVLKPGGVLLFETPNPENLVVGACTFNYDPTHQKPLPPELLNFVVTARGLPSRVIRRPEDCAVDAGRSEFQPQDYTDWFRLPMDYAIFATKPATAGA